MEELEKRLNKYIKLTEKAIKLASENITKDKEDIKKAMALLNLSECYFNDAKHFKNKGDLINAFAAVNYAHAFLDVGAILKLFKVKDSTLFMVD